MDKLSAFGSRRRNFMKEMLFLGAALVLPGCVTRIEPTPLSDEQRKAGFDSQFMGDVFAVKEGETPTAEQRLIAELEKQYNLELVCPETRSVGGQTIENKPWTNNEIDRVLRQGLERVPPVCFDRARNSNPVEKMFLVRPDSDSDYLGGGYIWRRIIVKLNVEDEKRDADPTDRRGLLGGFSTRLDRDAAGVVHEYTHGLLESRPELLDSFIKFHGWRQEESDGEIKWVRDKNFPGSVEYATQAQQSPIEAMAWDAGFVAMDVSYAQENKLYEWFLLPENQEIFGDWKVLDKYR